MAKQNAVDRHETAALGLRLRESHHIFRNWLPTKRQLRQKLLKLITELDYLFR